MWDQHGENLPPPTRRIQLRVPENGDCGAVEKVRLWNGMAIYDNCGAGFQPARIYPHLPICPNTQRKRGNKKNAAADRQILSPPSGNRIGILTNNQHYSIIQPTGGSLLNRYMLHFHSGIYTMGVIMNSQRLQRVIIVGLTILCLTGTIQAQMQRVIPVNRDERTDVVMQWWQAARYGMFIHWGPSSMGRNAPMESFNPIDFDAEEWVDIARNAGMKYIVYITKHHNGFCMFDSAYTDYDIVDYTPFGRDPLKELAEACRKGGIRLGLYYSITDVHHPEFHQKWWGGRHDNPNPNADLDKYVEYMQNQLRELLTNYGEIITLWFDDGGAFERPVVSSQEERAELLHCIETMDMMRSIQPAILINNRLGLGTTDYFTPEMYVPSPRQAKSLGIFETCMTINNTWFHNKNETNWKSPKEIVWELVTNAGMGGNYLLNVGPMANGEIDPVDEHILAGAGRWIHKYGESIYGTQASPVPQPQWGRITMRTLPNGNTRLYLHVFMGSETARDERWRDELVVEGLSNRPVQSYALASVPQRNYEASVRGNSIVVDLSGRAPDISTSVVVLDVEGEVKRTN